MMLVILSKSFSKLERSASVIKYQCSYKVTASGKQELDVIQKNIDDATNVYYLLTSSCQSPDIS